MTTRIFADVAETTEPKPEVTIAARLLYCGLASLVAVLPPIAAAIASYRVTSVFRNLRNAEDIGSAQILIQIDIFNTPLVIALAVAAVLALGIALLLTLDPRRKASSVGLPFSIAVPIIGAVPGLLLWFAETTVIDILTGKFPSGPVATVAATISFLLFCTIAWGPIAVGAAVLCSIVSLCIPADRRTEPLSPRRAFVWAVTGTLLLGFAGGYLILL